MRLSLRKSPTNVFAYNNTRRCSFAIVLEVLLPPRGALAFPNFLLHAPALFLAQAAQIGFSLVLGLAPPGSRIVAVGGLSQGGVNRQI